MAIDTLVVIERMTRLEKLLQRFVTLSQVKFYLEQSGDSFSEYKAEHDAYKAGLEKTLAALPSGIRSQRVEKELLPGYRFTEKDLVIAVGDDGLCVNAAKHLNSQLVVAVNADPARYDGVLASATPDTARQVIAAALSGKAAVEECTMAEAALDNGEVIYALNDLFIGEKTHASARYTLQHDNRAERQSSSGIIVTTGTGSTGWMQSVYTQAAALGGSCAFKVPFGREEEQLLFAVREPFPSKYTGTSVVFGYIGEKSLLKIVSHMPQHGVIFGDGMEDDYVEFNAGRTATISIANKKFYRATGDHLGG